MNSIYYNVKVAAVLWICMALFVLATGGRKKAKEDRFSTYILMVTMSAFLPTIGYIANAGEAGPGAFSWGFPTVSYVGFCVVLLGAAIHILGILTLKKEWAAVVVVTEGQKLVDSGIYKFIRHPIYAAILLELLGFGLALSSWLAILLLVLPNAASLTYRIYIEEKVLEKHFGDVYISYERRTKRLIPGIF